jgi:tetratricopeptide (TPR) repeat protein
VVLRAYGFFKSGTPELRARADELLDRAYESGGGNARIAFTLAERLLAVRTARSVARAREVIAGLTQEHPRLIDAWILSARAALAAGSAEGALEAVSHAMAARPSGEARRRTLILKASAESLRWPALARETLEDLWKENESDLTVALLLADACFEAGDADAAVDVVRKVLTAAPKAQRPSVSTALARTLGRAGRIDEAVRVVEEVRAADRAAVAPFVENVRLLALSGRVDDAAALVEGWRTENPDNVVALFSAVESLLSLADAQEGKTAGDVLETSLAAARTAEAEGSDDARSALLLAAVHQARGENAEAERQYRAILARRGDDPIALNNLAWLLSKDAGRVDEALELSERGARLYGGFADILDTRGVVLAAAGKTAEAREAFADCIDVARLGSPAGAAARFHLAELLAKAGEKDEARRLLSECTRAPHVGALSADDSAAAAVLLSELEG